MKKEKQVKKHNFKVGETCTMLFHYVGIVNEEKYKILKIENDILTMLTNDDENKCFKFHISTGACINDCNYDGAYRKLKI